MTVIKRKKTVAEFEAEFDAAMREVERTFKEWRAAQAKVNRSSKPASVAAANKVAKAAELAYRKASDRRDELVQIRNARLTQRGDARGAQWSKDGVDAPAIILAPGDKTRPVNVIRIKRGGYDPTLPHDHPHNFDPTLEEWPQCNYRFEHDLETDTPKGARCTNLATHRIIWEDEQRYSFGCNEHLEIEHDDASVKPAKVERLPWVHPQSGISFVRGPVPRKLLMKAAHKLGYLVRDYPDDKESKHLIEQLQALLAVP